MIDRQALLTDLQSLLRTLEADLLERSELPGAAEVPEVRVHLEAEYKKATEASRTAQSYEEWRSGYITQVAAAWVLSCVFARFLEDNQLIDPPKIAGLTTAGKGGAGRLQRARDEHELYFRQHPTETDREYLLSIFKTLADTKNAGIAEVFGEHNAIWELPNWLSGDAAGELLRFFQKIDADTGQLVHDFTDPEWDTRFLGDLYQDLSEAARKRYALLQTPEFVEEFILDYTLDPALDTFGLDAPPVLDTDGEPISGGGFRMIDPACGSGHFLLGAFHRILDRWQREQPNTNPRQLVQHALDAIHGVDVNPFAIAIARFRLLLAALKASSITRLTDAPAFHFHLAAGDALLHGATVQTGAMGAAGSQEVMAFHELAHHYAAEDIDGLQRILCAGTYHAVVANPPYITVKDRAVSAAYRERYPQTCHMKYSLAAPFMERIYRLAVGGGENGDTVGYTGQITANSFMKREFGRKLIEAFLPRVELSHVIDTSGAYIPGHGTPTVILFGRHRNPTNGDIRTVMGIRGEPSTPDDPAHGLVWSAIRNQIDEPGSESEFASVGDTARELFGKHPWSIGGGGAAELKDLLDSFAECRICDVVVASGVMAVPGEDEVFVRPKQRDWLRCGFNRDALRSFLLGESVRNWTATDELSCIYPYTDQGTFVAAPSAESHFWKYRSPLRNGIYFSKTREQRGMNWREYAILVKDKVDSYPAIAFGEVATHNHFVVIDPGVVLKNSAQVLKLPGAATKDDHLALLGLLNSSTACFWMKQACHNKGSTVDQHGARQRTDPFEDFFAFNGTKIGQFPLPADRPTPLARELDALARRRNELDAAEAIRLHMLSDAEVPEPSAADRSESPATLRDALNEAGATCEALRQRMIALQEELDWQVYGLYGLLDDPPTCNDAPPAIELGQRAFEVVMARKTAAGTLETTWFQRHRSTPITELPKDWPEAYRQVVERRIELIESDRNIGLIEQPEYKRRWNTEPWDSQVERALWQWLLDRLESYFDFDGRMTPGSDEGKPTAKTDIALISVAQLADIARPDEPFMEVGGVYRDDPAFDVEALVAELVEAESVPLLPVLRYKATGLRKRAAWEKTWELQRAEDAGEAVGAIPVPPKYKSSDFLKGSYWRLRGKLDVPKERWVSFPHCEGPDGTLMIAWAGYDHLQLAQAIGAYYADVQERLGGEADPRLVPLLAGLAELVPWLKQWHNEVDPEYNVPMGDYFEGFVNEEARRLGLTLDEVKAWAPVKRVARGKQGRRKASEAGK